MPGSGGSWLLDKPSAVTVRLRVSESPTWVWSGSGFQLSLRVRLRAGSQGRSAGQVMGLALTVNSSSVEVTRISLPDFAPWAALSCTGCASTSAALKICAGMISSPLCCG
ncbi:hypothetical protein D9M72_631430 [compost metagenome]